MDDPVKPTTDDQPVGDQVSSEPAAPATTPSEPVVEVPAEPVAEPEPVVADESAPSMGDPAPTAVPPVEENSTAETDDEGGTPTF